MKKKIFLILAILVVIAGAVSGYFYFSSNRRETFTAEEQRWLDSNKNNVVDIYIPRNIAGFTYMGKGVFFDFIADLEKKTNLTFNKVPYDAYDDVSERIYAIELVDEASSNQLFVMRDNYVVVSKKNDLYTVPSEMKDLKVGVLDSDRENVEKYLSGSKVEFISYESEEKLLEAFQSADGALDALVGLRSLYLDDIFIAVESAKTALRHSRRTRCDIHGLHSRVFPAPLLLVEKLRKTNKTPRK